MTYIFSVIFPTKEQGREAACTGYWDTEHLMKKIIRGNLIKDKISRGNLIKDKIRGYVLFRKKLRRYSRERMGYLLDQNWKGYFEKKMVRYSFYQLQVLAFNEHNYIIEQNNFKNIKTGYPLVYYHKHV